MNLTLEHASLFFEILTVGTAPALLLASVFWKPTYFWKAYWIMSLIMFWGAGSIAPYLYHEHLWQEMQVIKAKGGTPPKDLIEDWASDTAVGFMPVMGWTYAIFYTLFCFVVYFVISSIYLNIRRKAEQVVKANSEQLPAQRESPH